MTAIPPPCGGGDSRRRGLTCAGLKGERLAADIVVFVGVHPQTILGPLDQVAHLNGGLLFDRHSPYCSVALETQCRGDERAAVTLQSRLDGTTCDQGHDAGGHLGPGPEGRVGLGSQWIALSQNKAVLSPLRKTSPAGLCVFMCLNKLSFLEPVKLLLSLWVMSSTSVRNQWTNAQSSRCCFR